MTTSAWWTGSCQTTQTWGATSYTGEPPGHGAPHWHAGEDEGLPQGTQLFAGRAGTVVSKGGRDLAGYGDNAIRFRLDQGGVDIILGHLSQSPAVGTHVAQGAPLARSGGANPRTDGNTSGPHLHFEVRPIGGAYGSDIDPTPWLIASGASPIHGGDDMKRDDVAGYVASTCDQYMGRSPAAPADGSLTEEGAFEAWVDYAIEHGLRAFQIQCATGKIAPGLKK